MNGMVLKVRRLAPDCGILLRSELGEFTALTTSPNHQVIACGIGAALLRYGTGVAPPPHTA